MEENSPGIMLNLGCGENAPEGWINIDGSIHALLGKRRRLHSILCKIFHVEEVYFPPNIKIMDVRKGLRFSDNSVAAIFYSHLLEHMRFEDAARLVKESYRCLVDGGIIRVIVPDLYQEATLYIEKMGASPEPEHSYAFLEGLGIVRQNKAGTLNFCYRLFSHQRHLYMYDETSLRQLLKEAGFVDIERMKYGESRIQGVKKVERKDRHERAVCLEGIKRL